MQFGKFLHGHISLSSGIFSETKNKVEEQSLWGPSGDMSGLEMSGGRDGPESECPTSWRLMAHHVGEGQSSAVLQIYPSVDAFLGHPALFLHLELS